ncbi:hypothetical protein, conserved [Eimeria acervulina]|uniref:Uncharacterized protein n=1 Tax=Eimeria acervulina TaxID=5801 RepID=U6GTS9_EIMAC|nr:hypothetical protein, conserved [Eimeria acervulina]CDI82698.1 hypothetical protein, conserved [Eimeria acervulina]
MFTPTEPPYTAAPQDASFIFSVAKDVWGKVPPPPGFTVPWRLAVPSTGVQSPFTLPDPPAIPIDLQREYLTTTFPAPAPSGESFTSLHHSHAFQQSPPGSSFTAPPSPKPAQGPSLEFPTFAVQRTISRTAQHVGAPLRLSSRGRRQTRTTQFGARVDSQQIEGEGAQGGTFAESMLETRLFDPLAPLIAEAFPTAGPIGVAGVERRVHGEHSPSHPPSPSGAS